MPTADLVLLLRNADKLGIFQNARVVEVLVTLALVKFLSKK
jgi:hypothetical protein